LTGYLLDRFLALKYLASSTFDAKYISHSALRNKYSTEDEYADYKDEVADYKNKVADYKDEDKDEEVDNEDETTNDEDTAVNLRLTDASHIQHDTDMSENSRRIRRSLCQRKSRVVGNSKGRQ
jgi:CRISPR/Cas system CSM-associated protein Csm4 (group 5 of RAMP superfamily)